MQRTYTNGTVVYEFPNGQTEKHFPDKTQEVAYADGTVRWVHANGDDVVRFPNGIVQKTKNVSIAGRVESVIEIEYVDGTKVRRRDFHFFFA